MKGLLASISLAGILAFIAWGAHVFMHSKIFEVLEIHASGLERLNEAEIVERLRPSSGTSLFDLDLVSLKGKLLAEPWIKEVSLRREYPDALSVRVIERRPAAVLTDRTVTAIVDETGAIIEEWPNAGKGASNLPEGPRNFPKRASTWSSLPVIHGVETVSLKNRDPRAMQGVLTAIELLHAAPLTEYEGFDLDVGQPDDVRVQRHGYRLRFGPGPFGEKWRRFLSVENEIERRHDAVREVDLRFPEQVIVR